MINQKKNHARVGRNDLFTKPQCRRLLTLPQIAELALRFLLILLVGWVSYYNVTALHAADIDTEIKAKELEITKVKAQADGVRADLSQEHPGDTRPPEDIIQADIAFETQLDNKLQDARKRLSKVEDKIELVKLTPKKLREAIISGYNADLAPFFRLDVDGNLHLGPGLYGLPGHFTTTGFITVPAVKQILSDMIKNNAEMKQKRQNQLSILGDEKRVAAELKQLKLKKQRRKIVKYWVECDPSEIFTDESAICKAKVRFEDGSTDQYNVRSTWTGAPGGIVRGKDHTAGTTVTVRATYQAPADQGGRLWSGHATVKIKKRSPGPKPPQPPPTITPPTKSPPKPTKPGNTAPEKGPEVKPPPPPPTAQESPFSVQFDCGNSFELAPGDFVGRGCGLIVKGWKDNGNRVKVKVEYAKRSGIEIFPGDTSAPPSLMFTPGVTDFYDRYIFSESFRAKSTAPKGITPVTMTVSQKGTGSVTIVINVSVLAKGELPSGGPGIRPPANVASGSGGDFCVWRYKMFGDPPPCFHFVKAKCDSPRYNKPQYELVGANMTWGEGGARMAQLSTYFDDAYGCRKTGNSSDKDGDGVVDDNDKCPGTPKGVPVDATGCGKTQKDSDKDGVKDSRDKCPGTPSGLKVDAVGCADSQKDSDGDGVNDSKDKCKDDPNKSEPGECGCGTPETDKDGDSTPDCKDNCPDDADKTEPGDCGCGTPETDKDGDGTPDCNDNCPDDADKVEPGECGCGTSDTDKDGDGIPDCNDNCSDTANADQADNDNNGLGDACEQKKDRDGDGVPDDQDNCPDKPNPDQHDSNNNGIGDLCDQKRTDGGCADDSDCERGYVCVSGQCKSPFDDAHDDSTDLLTQREGERQQDNAQQTITDQGANTSRDGFTSDDLDESIDDTQTFVGTECNDRKPCPAGQTCEDGKCVNKDDDCQSDSDCPKGQVCKDGHCADTSDTKPKGLIISPANKAVKLNEAVTFKATLQMDDGTTKDVTAEAVWSPGNPFSKGTIGQYTVKATYQDVSATAMVTVVEEKGMDDITVNSKTITVTFFDHGRQDGDMIDILINGKAVFSGITLTKAPQSRSITMNADIIVFGFRALNEGKIPPNTATVTFTSVVKGKSTQKYELKKNQKTNMNITYSP